MSTLRTIAATTLACAVIGTIAHLALTPATATPEPTPTPTTAPVVAPSTACADAATALYDVAYAAIHETAIPLLEGSSDEYTFSQGTIASAALLSDIRFGAYAECAS